MDYQILAIIESYKKLISIKDEQINFYRDKLDHLLKQIDLAKVSLEGLGEVSKYV